MGCKIQNDPTRIRTFQAPANVDLNVHIDSKSGLAKLTAANLNKSPITVTNDRAVAFKLVAGMNVLLLTVVSPDPTDTITLVEDCDGGSTNKLRTDPYDPNDPVKTYRIFGL